MPTAGGLFLLCEHHDRTPTTLRRILLAYWALNPWPSADGFAGLVDRYREICFDCAQSAQNRSGVMRTPRSYAASKLDLSRPIPSYIFSYFSR